MKHPEFTQWGVDIDQAAIAQMEAAVRLPVSVAGALMPDAHVGYGLPIGGVLATDNAVIPYAVGVDIACRMMMTVFDIPPTVLQSQKELYVSAINTNTRFGVGAEWKPARRHDVLDDDWNVSPVTAQLKEKARRQLGTSGSGNHFVEFGELTIDDAAATGLGPGAYLALLSHSGSRGTGAAVAGHYTRVAKQLHPDLDSSSRNLAWLRLGNEGDEYWAAMELMGKYASANHHVIHDSIIRFLGHPVIRQIENHHNFAWRETYNGRPVVVHRKGATPAGKGTLGIIPGSMGTPGYLVEGLGNKASLASAAHGAGRRMSRTAAKKNFRWKETLEFLRERGIVLLSAGLDEVPFAYKDITQVMEAQKDLARPVATFMPRLVKMAPAGERPED